MQPTDSDLLRSIRIASPCTADWSAMTGDERRRFCQQCKLHVHDLSAMTTDEAVDLLRAAGQGRLCVRYYRRADGTVLTQDCPKGLRRRLRQMWVRAAALVVALWSGSACTKDAASTPGAAGGGAAGPTMGSPAPAAPTPPPPVLMGEMEMGDVMAPVRHETPPEALQGKVALPPRRVAPPK